MTFLWLVVWLIAGTPDVDSWGPWNSWGIALFVCLAIDVISALGAGPRASGGVRWRARKHHHH